MEDGTQASQGDNSFGGDLETGFMGPTNKEIQLPTDDNRNLQHQDEDSFDGDLETGLKGLVNKEIQLPTDNHHLQHKDEDSFDGDLETGLKGPVNKEIQLPTDNHHLQHKDEDSFDGHLETGLKGPVNKEIQLPTDNDHLQHKQGVTSVGVAKVPATQGASAATVENKHKEMIEELHKAKGKFKLDFASFAVLFGCSGLLCFMFLPKKSVNENILKAVSILGFLNLITGFCLMIHTLFMLARSNTFTRSIHDTISKGLIIISCTALLASLIPLLLLHRPYNLLVPVVWAVVLLTLCFGLYLRSQTNDKEKEKDQTQYEDHIKDIPRLSELNHGLVSLSSSGLIGILFGIHKNASNHAHNPVVSASVFLLFLPFLLSICLMHLCQMRLMHLSPSTRKNFLRVAEGLCKFLLVMLAFAALAIAFIFLKWYTVMVFIPVLFVCAVWLIESCTMNPHNVQDTLEEEDLSIKKEEEEEDLKLTYTKGSKVTSISFGGITAIFSGYLGSDEKKMHLNICMIFLASAFLCGQSLMLLSYKPSTRPHIDSAFSILTYFAISLLVFGIFTIFILEFMRL